MEERKVRREEAHALEMLRMHGLILALGAQAMKEARKTRADLDWDQVRTKSAVNHMLATALGVLNGEIDVEIQQVSKEQAEAMQSITSEKPSIELPEEQREAFEKWMAALLGCVNETLGIEYTDKISASDFVKAFVAGKSLEQAVADSLK